MQSSFPSTGGASQVRRSEGAAEVPGYPHRLFVDQESYAQILKLEPQIPPISQISRRLLGMTAGTFLWQNFRVSLIVTYCICVMCVIAFP